MPRVPWHLFEDCQPRAYLVVGVVAQAEGPVGGDEGTQSETFLIVL
jgi:hypothetical protein